jgi:hypothetical protein
MRYLIRTAALTGLFLMSACHSLDVPDLNNPGQDDLENSPTPAGVKAAATGLLIGTRATMAAQNGYIMELGILGRESYNLDPADPRFVSELLLGPLDGGSGAFGGNFFPQSYKNIRNANIVLHALAKVQGMSAADVEATTGFAQTIQALDFLNVVNTRDTLGAPIAVDISPSDPPAPIVPKAQVLAHIANLLDSAQTNLVAADSVPFPFGLSPGFAGFDSTQTFLKFNRALRARAAVYSGDYAGALTYLAASFLDVGAPLTLGVYHSFSTASGDSLNTLFDASVQDASVPRALFAHASIRTDAQLQAGGLPDQRVLNKTALFPAKTQSGISVSVKFTIYGSPVASIPIIRNEELILLRAEANIGLNNLGPAVTDLNLIRTTSGNLPAYAGPVTQPALLDELLYNKRYSLLLEGGHRWIDLRRYGRLNTLPLDAPSHHRFSFFPFPSNECLARTPTPASGCVPEVGF